MIGRLLNQDGRPVAVLNDAGDWEPAAADPDELDAAVAHYLNTAHHPGRNAQTGDHHLPRGVMAMNRAAEAGGLTVDLAAPIPPLPPGAVS